VHVVASWSGGKDSYLAYHEAMSQGLEVSSLFNYVLKETGKPSKFKVSSLFNYVFRVGGPMPGKVQSLFTYATKNILVCDINHEVTPEVIPVQAKAMEIPLVQFDFTWVTFVDKFKTMIRSIKPKVEGVVFGVEGTEIDDHNNPLHHVCDELGIKLIMPLRGKSEEQILEKLVKNHVEAIVVVVGTNLLGEEWLGHKIDREFMDEISRLSREKGVPHQSIEYHSLVVDAPLFKKRLKVLESKKVSKDGYSVLDISRVKLIEKT
jgi:uncharacterized protein (TIGR00290 family)